MSAREQFHGADEAKASGQRLIARLLLLLALLLPVLEASVASAKSPFAMRLRLGRKFYSKQDYERSIRVLAPIVQSPLATIDDKVGAFELMGLCYLILGDKVRAGWAFEQVLRLDAAHELNDPSGSPKLREFYEQVKRKLFPGYVAKEEVKIAHNKPVVQARAGTRLNLAAKVTSGVEQVAWLLLHWRKEGEARYQRAILAGDRSRQATVALPASERPFRLQYYIEARNEEEEVIAGLGAANRPLTIPVQGVPPREKSSSPAFYKTWWFWTAVGVVVAGGVATGVVLGTRKSAPAGNLPPGSWQLP